MSTLVTNGLTFHSVHAPSYTANQPASQPTALTVFIFLFITDVFIYVMSIFFCFVHTAVTAFSLFSIFVDSFLRFRFAVFAITIKNAI